MGAFLKQFSTKAQCREYLVSLQWKKGYVCPRWCLHKLSVDSSPNSDTTDVYRNDKGIRGLGIASSNTSPTFQS